MGHSHFDVRKLIHSIFQHLSPLLSSLDGLKPDAFNYFRLKFLLLLDIFLQLVCVVYKRTCILVWIGIFYVSERKRLRFAEFVLAR